MVYGPNHPDADADGCVVGDDPCGKLGMIYGPEHPNADGNGCVLGLDIEDDGRVTFSGVTAHESGIKLGDGGVCDPDHEGVLRYAAPYKTVLFCDGQNWQEIGAAPEASTTFNDVSDAEPGDVYTTGQAQLSGFFGERTVSVTNGAIILVNGSAQGSTATIESGDYVQLRMTASNNFGTSKTTTMTMSSLVTSWTVTTRDQDVTPDPFSFNDLTDQALDATVSSDPVTPSGYDGPLAVSVSGQGSPALSVNGGAWGASATIDPGDSVRLRLTTSSDTGVAHSATVNLGAGSDVWSVTTGTYEYGSWSGWSSCSASCGGGSKTRTRACEFTGGGTVDCSECGGNCTDSTSCNTHSCCHPDAGDQCWANTWEMYNGDCVVRGGGYATIQCDGSCPHTYHCQP
ncbi:hypothetical protein [Minwuia thermotolerans]|nr:hypothetical protein [Minwuia thermotolerans]